MMTDNNIWQKRMTELYRRAEMRACVTYSEFLTIDKQDELSTLFCDEDFVLDGGYPTAERKVAFFGVSDEYEKEGIIDCIRITVKGSKFEKPLTHRDYLGSLMALGMKRELFGDIVLTENAAYLFLLNSATQYVLDNLKTVSRLNALCETVSELPRECLIETPPSDMVVASTRLDVMVSGAFNLSRTDASKLIEQKKVFINGREATKNDAKLDEGDKVSVRGFGRFVFVSENSKTRKDRLKVTLIINK